MKSPVVISVIAQVTCPAAFQSRSLMIHNNPNIKAINERPNISKTLPNVNKAIRFPTKSTAASQSRDRAKSLRRKRDPMISVANRLSANQMVERYKARTSIYRVPPDYLSLKFKFSIQSKSKVYLRMLCVRPAVDHEG